MYEDWKPLLTPRMTTNNEMKSIAEGTSDVLDWKVASSGCIVPKGRKAPSIQKIYSTQSSKTYVFMTMILHYANKSFFFFWN